jgi:hypothetical protein
VDEFINQRCARLEKPETICDLCGAKVKSQNVREHRAKVHPDRVLGTIDQSKGYVVLK